jgi:hypothetical protein
MQVISVSLTSVATQLKAHPTRFVSFQMLSLRLEYPISTLCFSNQESALTQTAIWLKRQAQV